MISIHTKRDPSFSSNRYPASVACLQDKTILVKVSFTQIYLSLGTRIIYDRKFLLDRRNSPIAQTPPAHLPVIPGVTSQNILRENQKNEANNHINNHGGKPAYFCDIRLKKT
uniref:Uncharacterized protein n=1 Tax=Oryzias sinensis TaxID=183150 RepID=A0A8C7ZRV5_9TELE